SERSVHFCGDSFLCASTAVKRFKAPRLHFRIILRNRRILGDSWTNWMNTTVQSATINSIRRKVEARERLSFDDGRFLYDHADLFTLGELANLVRERKNGNFAYYNVNTHLNPTNLCIYRCIFCAFRADLKSPKGYVMSDEQILERAGEAERRGATE